MEGDPSEKGSGMRIYLDLDETLIGNVIDPLGNVLEIRPRPGASWFIRTMSQHGELWLLTAAAREHAKRALRKLGRESKRFKGIITREDMEPIEQQIDVVLQSPGLTDEVRMELWDQIKPIASPGVIFDDFPVGSKVFALKSKAVGIGDRHWIQVEPYRPGMADYQGLKRAYSEFISRLGNRDFAMGRRRVLAWR